MKNERIMNCLSVKMKKLFVPLLAVVLLLPVCNTKSKTERMQAVVDEVRTKYKANMEKKKLYRSMTDKKLCGVCGGIAEYFEIDPTLVRLLWVCASLFSACFPGLLAYIICAIVVPQQNQLPNP